MTSRNNPFLSAILYADIFDFPLTGQELWHYAIGRKNNTKKYFSAFLSHLPESVATRDGYYFLKGRGEIVKLRKRREKESQKKMLLATRASRIIASIPTVLFVGVSGGLSRLNADIRDDIDLFLIVKKRRLWVTRFYVALLLQMYGLRRQRRDATAPSKICVNMLIDERMISFSEKRQDIYTAHEIAQLLPLVNKKNTYQKFRKANMWTSSFLPNAPLRDVKSQVNELPFFTNDSLETVAKHFQLWYMKRHVTKEEITDSMLAFHPVDYRSQTLAAFAHRKNLYEKI